MGQVANGVNQMVVDKLDDGRYITKVRGIEMWRKITVNKGMVKVDDGKYEFTIDSFFECNDLVKKI